MNFRSQTISSDPIVGLGPTSAKIFIYIPHSPPCLHLSDLTELRPAVFGELKQIGIEAGNHWRKIINIAAKLGYAIDSDNQESWQCYRDHVLCQTISKVALLFNQQYLPNDTARVHVISGHQYSQQLTQDLELTRIGDDFACCASRNVIDSPYFDYRQLSNAKLSVLVDLVQSCLARQVKI